MLHIMGIIFLCILCAGAGAAIGGFYMGHKYCVELIDARKIANKHLDIIRVYDMWMMVGHDAIKNYLIKSGITSIVIYGFSYLGKRLYYEMKDSGINIQYAIDNSPKEKIKDFSIVKPHEKEKNLTIDAVIVTAIYDYEDIKESLECHGYNNIISLYGILYEIAQNKQ